MKIRGKLLVLLLVIALIPLLLTAAYSLVSVRNMGESLADQAGTALQKRIAHQLELMIQYNARMLRQKQELVEAWLRVLAEAAEDALAKVDPVARPAYLAADYDQGRIPRHQIFASRRHLRHNPTGQPTPVPISTHAQVLRLAPGVDADAVAESVLRLSSLTGVYQQGYVHHEDLFYWIITSLEDGVHSSFPGHGGYPPDYDARKRSWYTRAVEARELVWSDFIIDASTGQALATVSKPIYGTKGMLAGVVAIDLPVQAILNQIRTESELSRDARVYLVNAVRDDTGPALELLGSLEDQHRDWHEPPEATHLRVADPDFEAMIDDINAGRHGVKRMPLDGVDSVWAYGIYESGAHALVIVIPFTHVVEHVQNAKDYILGETLGIVAIIALFALVLIGLIVAAAWGSSLSVTEPVRELAGAAHRLAGGDFEVRVPVRSKDEIGQLSGVFNDMAPQLLDRIKARESLTHLGRYFSPNLAQQLTENPELLDVGGERRDMTFVFTDLAGFTGLVETSRPEDIVPILNEYLDGMTRIVWEHEGTIDKVVGDAVHAMFGAPLDQPDHAARGVRCALDMDTYSESFRENMRLKGVNIGITRIGINTGHATVGNFGGELMFDYTAHGDAINTAARLEGANKFFGTRIAVSENTVNEINEFLGRPIGKLILKGRSTGLMTFEPVSEEAYASQRIQDYLKAYASLAANETAALSAFEELSRAYPDDPLVAFHLARLESGEHGETITLAGK